jgi:hypothetical protein
MKHLLATFYSRPLAVYLIFALVAFSTVAGPVEAMHLPASDAVPSVMAPDRAADLAKVQKVLESKELRQKLLDYGLTPEETEARINNLSDEQLHRFASNLDSVQAGSFQPGSGSTVRIFFGLMLLAFVIVIIILIQLGWKKTSPEGDSTTSFKASPESSSTGSHRTWTRSKPDRSCPAAAQALLSFSGSQLLHT